ncbi:MAG: VWA domain-containing protein [Acidobacteriota bacterium]
MLFKAVFVSAFLFVSLVQPCGAAPQRAAAQDKARAVQEPLRNEVTVTLKLVQIYVTDDKGKPALDMEKGDFILRDNGELQTISAFEKHFLKISAAPGQAAPVQAPPAKETPSVISRKYIFLIDYVRNNFKGIEMARKAALEFMDKKLQPGDEIALFSISTTSGLTLHEYLTTDHGKVRAAVKKLRDVPGRLPTAVDSLEGHEPMGMEIIAAEVIVPHLAGGVHLGAKDSRDFFAEAHEWAKALSHIPGEKNLIFFTQGFGKGVVKPNNPRHALFRAMTRALAAANVPVFSIDTTTGELGLDALIAKGVFPEASLDYLSNMTGGKYVGDVANYTRNAEDIQAATGNYYVLGYSIPAAWDGRYHEIRVEVRKPGYKVYGQRGYTNPLPFNKLSPMEKHLHLIDLALSEKGPAEQHLGFPLAALPFSGGEGADAILLASIPVTRLRQDIGDRTEFVILVLNENRAIADGKRFEIDWSMVKGEAACEYSAVSLPPGRYECRVIIRNLDDGKGAVGACSFVIPAKTDAAWKLDPPLLLAPGTEIPYLNVTGEAKGGGESAEAKTLSLFKIFPFPAKEYTPLMGEIERGVPAIFAVLRSIRPAGGDSRVELTAWLVPEGKDEKIPLDFDIMNTARQEPADILLLELDVPDLAPGMYALHILAEDKAANASAETKTELRIKP